MLWPSSGGYRLQSTRMQPENIWKEGGGGEMGRSLLRRQNATDGRPSFLRPRRRESRVAAFDPWERKWSPAPQPDRLASLIDPLTEQRKKKKKTGRGRGRHRFLLLRLSMTANGLGWTQLFEESSARRRNDKFRGHSDVS